MGGKLPPAILLALLLLLFSCCSGQNFDVIRSKETNEPPQSASILGQEDEQVTPIYSNGKLMSNWRENSVGCDQCVLDDASAARNSSKASFSAKVAERGILRLTSLASYPSNSILDFWVSGSGLTSISLYIKDSATNTVSKEVRFTSAEVMRGVTILGNDDDGFIRMHIDLAALRTTNSTDAPSKDTGKQPPAQGNSCSTPPGVASRFDTIEVKDISNMGFRLVLDDIRLISSASFSVADSPLLPLSNMVPVLADDLDELKSGNNRYLLKLKRNTTPDQLKDVCRELSSGADNRRFTGMCHSNLATLSKGGLLSFTVNTKGDLRAMRKALGGISDYFEADLTAFTTVRALQDAVKNKANRKEIPVNEIILVPGDTAERPCWAENHCSDFNLTAGERPSWASRPPVTRSSDATTQSSDAAPSVEMLQPAPVDRDVIVKLDPIKHNDDQINSSLSGSQDAMIQGAPPPWGLDRIDQQSLPLDNSYNPGEFDGRGVHIYVLDTGVRTSHVDFKGRVGAGASSVGSSVMDDNGHGTHVAGIALGGIHGVAKSAILHPVKVMGADGSGSYSNIIAGIDWVKRHKASNNINAAVMTMSLAGPRSQSLNDAIDAASNAGITVITAAGNNKGGDSCTMSPCSASTPIVVGASTDSDNMASFSNIGRCLTIFAPGNYIYSASSKGDNSEAIMSGTSMATPHVAGAAALYLQMRPNAPPAEVKGALSNAAVRIMFERSSPDRLLYVASSRLRQVAPKAATPAPAPAAPAPSTPAPATKPAPAPQTQPAPAPQPQQQQPQQTFPGFPSGFGGFPMPSSLCRTCSWCTFC